MSNATEPLGSRPDSAANGGKRAESPNSAAGTRPGTAKRPTSRLRRQSSVSSVGKIAGILAAKRMEPNHYVFNFDRIDFGAIIHEAVKRGDFEYVEYLLSKYPHLINTCKFGESLLTIALKMGHCNIFELLVGCGLDPHFNITLCDFNNSRRRLERHVRSLYELANDLGDREEFIKLLDDIDEKHFHFDKPIAKRRRKTVSESLLLFTTKRDRERRFKDPVDLEDEHSMDLGVLLYTEPEVEDDNQTVTPVLSRKNTMTTPLNTLNFLSSSSARPSNTASTSSLVTTGKEKLAKSIVKAIKEEEEWLSLRPSSPNTVARRQRDEMSLEMPSEIGATRPVIGRVLRWHTSSKGRDNNDDALVVANFRRRVQDQRIMTSIHVPTVAANQVPITRARLPDILIRSSTDIPSQTLQHHIHPFRPSTTTATERIATATTILPITRESSTIKPWTAETRRAPSTRLSIQRYVDISGKNSEKQYIDAFHSAAISAVARSDTPLMLLAGPTLTANSQSIHRSWSFVTGPTVRPRSRHG